MTVYRGPVVPPATSNANHVEVVRLVYSQPIAANASGLLSASFTNNPTAASDYSSYAGLYSEYRTLATRIRWIPVAQGFQSGTSSNFQGPMVIYTIRSITSYSAPPNFAEAYDNDGAKVHHISREWVVTARMNGTPDSDWVPTSSPTATWAHYLFATGLSPSAGYGYIFIDFLCQFRGRV